MKKWISASLLALTLVGSFAHAFEGVFIPQKNGELKIQPLHQKCDETPQPATVGEEQARLETQGYCNPGTTKDCPKGYQATSKFCWGGWHRGFYKCGYACRSINPDCQRGYNHPDCWHYGKDGN
ncbi:MAG: hypothetical protein J7501_15800 [Bdellovibrio sp.]|nr:hypothetical protein [Bdellovibrio sp.]